MNILNNLKEILELELMFLNKEDILFASNSANKVKKNESNLDEIKNQIVSCKKCNLSLERTNVVVGEGNINAELMFIGEAPGYEEDKSARPFVGEAGKLLTKMINAINIKREDVYIANILKCRPPLNRNPKEDEIELCVPYLYSQIEIIKPKVICTLGAVAAHALLNTKQGITKLRGKKFKYKDITLIPTFHPSYLLRNEEMKKYAWEDLKLVSKILNKTELI